VTAFLFSYLSRTGVVAQLNHELMSQGQAPMGWINPWIYANPQMFTDVTEGSNPYEKCDGFYASGTSLAALLSPLSFPLCDLPSTVFAPCLQPAGTP
jgi:hypothetical protein